METAQTDTTDTTDEAERRDSSQSVLRVVGFDSVAIQRLISEVRADEPVLVGGRYDRTYNRHNR